MAHTLCLFLVCVFTSFFCLCSHLKLFFSSTFLLVVFLSLMGHYKLAGNLLPELNFFQASPAIVQFPLPFVFVSQASVPRILEMESKKSKRPLSLLLSEEVGDVSRRVSVGTLGSV